MSDPVVFGFCFSFCHFFWSFFPWLVNLLFSPLAICVRFCDTSIMHFRVFTITFVLKRKGAQGWVSWKVYYFESWLLLYSTWRWVLCSEYTDTDYPAHTSVASNTVQACCHLHFVDFMYLWCRRESHGFKTKPNKTKQKVPLRTSNPMSNPTHLTRKQGETWKGKTQFIKSRRFIRHQRWRIFSIYYAEFSG